jgi:alpha-tubulin suppressor-like RCC1 family protein
VKGRVAAALVGALLAGAGCGDGGHAAADGGDALGGSDGGAGDGADRPDGGGGTAIVVDTPPGAIATGKLDGHCDLLEAAVAAATGYSVNDCANPNGLARIVVQPGQSYLLSRTLHLSGATELGIPDGTTGRATISAAPGFAVDPGDPATACLVAVGDPKANVAIADVELTQDPSVALSGLCFSRGDLALRRARVTGFRAGGLVATCLPTSGCDHEGDTQQAATLRVMNSLVDGNHNPGNGGGIASEGSGAAVFIAHSAIVNNDADGDGGGLYLGGGWGTDIVDSCTVSGNSASGVGGGVLVRFAEHTNTYVNVLTSTIAHNTAGSTGGGIEFDPAAAGMQDVSVFSSIVAANFSRSTLEWNINAGWSTPTVPGGPAGLFNCVDGSFMYVVPGNPLPNDMGGCTFDVRNPLLGPLTPLGGEGDLPLHPLLVGSPAVDAAPGLATPDDQRDAWIAGIDAVTPPDWTVFDPLVDGDGDGTAARDLGAYERNDRWQAELLAVRAQGPSALTVVTIPAGYDRGAGAAYAATSATNEFVTFALPIGEPGFYDLTVGARRDTDAGRFQIAIADAATGPWTAVGDEQDGYGAGSGFVSLGPFPSPLFATSGERFLRFSVTGKNPASAGYRLYLDYIEVKKGGTFCTVASVAAGGSQTCAVTTAGSLRCWGANGAGQLGDGTTNDRAAPAAVDVVSNAVAVAVGASHTCVLGADGNVRCWGSGANGRLGNGSTAALVMPPAQPAISGVKAIAAGSAHTCALTTAGGVRCWGANDHGQLGDGTMNDRTTPSGDVLTGVAAITAGGSHTCALTTAGGVRCWGENSSGQLGDGTTNDRATPPTTDVASAIAAVSAGDTHTCALTTAGGVRCWGHNNDGELGIGSYDPVLAPPAADAITGVAQVVAGDVFTCVRLTTGGVRCWGYNQNGAIGDDTAIAVDRLTPQTADILGGVASLAAGLTHVCALMTSGGVRCWGGNDGGQLGDDMSPIFALTPPTMDIAGFAGTCP